MKARPWNNNDNPDANLHVRLLADAGQFGNEVADAVFGADIGFEGLIDFPHVEIVIDFAFIGADFDDFVARLRAF